MILHLRWLETSQSVQGSPAGQDFGQHRDRTLAVVIWAATNSYMTIINRIYLVLAVGGWRAEVLPVFIRGHTNGEAYTIPPVHVGLAYELNRNTPRSSHMWDVHASLPRLSIYSSFTVSESELYHSITCKQTLEPRLRLAPKACLCYHPTSSH
jgi:hypothetical protein